MPTDKVQDLVAWTAPDGPEVDVIRLLHRDHDGTIPFHRKVNGRMQGVASVPAADVGELFPQYLAPLLDEDGYYGINGMFPSRYIRDIARLDGIKHPKIRQAVRSANVTRYLTSCWVDLDYYNKPGMTLGIAVGIIVDLQDQGVIPPASLLVDSGRGLWAFWRLRDDDHRGPIRQTAASVGTFGRIQNALARTCRMIEPDYGANDVARITRVPGSKNSKSGGRRVRYWLQADDQGPFTYTLGELAALVNVAPPKMSDGYRKVLNPKYRERGIKGHKALNQQRLDRLGQLIGLRGVINEGCRNRFALLLAATSRSCKIDEAEILDTVTRFGKVQCSPPLTDDEIADAMKASRKYRGFRNHKIGDWLKITPDESAAIGLPAEGDHDATTDAPRGAKERRAQRRSLVDAMIKQCGGVVPSIRQIIDFIEEHADGYRPSTQTIHKDLIELGYRDDPKNKPDRDAHALLDVTTDAPT